MMYLPVTSMRCAPFGILSPAILIAQAAPQNEAGKFRLHKFEQAIGEENYTITPDGGALTLKTDFKFTDRGRTVPLDGDPAHLRQLRARRASPSRATRRACRSRDRVTIAGANTTIQQGKETRTVSTPQTFFTISGYPRSQCRWR